MTDSHFDNSNNGDQKDRPQPEQPAHDGGAAKDGAESQPARPPRRDGDGGGDHWYNQYKPTENSGEDRPRRPYRKDDNASGGGSFRPYRKDDNASGGGSFRPYRPYKRDNNNGEGGDRPYRPYKRFNRDENGGEGGDRPYRPYKRFNRDENGGEGGDRPYRPYNRDNSNGEGGERPFRRPFNRDGNNGEGGDRPYRPYKRFNRDENGGDGGERPYRRPFNRDNNGEGGERPFRRPFNRDGNGDGGERPYRRPFNRDENGGEGGERPFRRPFNRDGNGDGGDRPYRRPFNRDNNGEGGDRPYRRPFNRDENGEGGEKPYRRPFNRDGNGEGGERPFRRPFNRDENGDRPPRPPRRFGDRFGDRRDNGPADEMSERSVIDSNRKDDIAISGDRPYRPYSPYLMEDENGVMHASYRPFKKTYEVDADGIAHPPRKTEGQDGDVAKPPRDFGNRDDAKGADNATWSFNNQNEKTADDAKQLPEHDGSDELNLEEILTSPENQPAEQGDALESTAAEQPSEVSAVPAENDGNSQVTENKEEAPRDAWPRQDRFSRRDGDGFDRPRRRFDRDGNGDGFDRPRRRFDRDGNGDGFNRPPRRRFGDDNGEGGVQPQEGAATEAGAPQNQEEEQPLPYARKQRIAVFGGSFDPIHNGHLLIAQKVLELDKADEVLFVPALLPPHKMDGLVATPEQRLEMVKLALAPLEKCSFTDVELQRAGAPSYTFDTMSILKQIYSDCELFLLIGMDSLLGLHSWYRAPELVTRGKFIIYPRPGSERPPIYELEKEFGSKNAYKLYYSILDDPELAQSDVSSTAIREAIAQHLSLDKYVPQAVAQYIHDNNIYS